MRITTYITSALRSSKYTQEERPEYDFDRISSYFYKSEKQDALQYIDAETCSDLDLNPLFEHIDRTVSKVGQQYLYARLRTLQGEEEVSDFMRCTAYFQEEKQVAERCAHHLEQLRGEEAYALSDLIFDTPAKVRYLRAAYLLAGLSALSLVASIFYPILLLLFVAIFATNLYIHYTNKLDITSWGSAVRQLCRTLHTARALAAEPIPGVEQAEAHILRTAEVERRSRIVSTQGDGGSELAAIGWLAFELLKAAFNIETILFSRFIGSITANREPIHGLFRFIGQTDAAIAVMQLREHSQTCTPRFTDGKYLSVSKITHPLIENCVANTLTLDSTGLLLTGSNMSGKTTFIRTLTLNALLAETLGICFAESYTAPYAKIFTSIRITDDLSEGTSYYLQEVLKIKQCLDASQQDTPCLFALDELFKGTNTTERIAAGKAVLRRLNRNPHIVLVSTHDTELTELLGDENYELYHFQEQVSGDRLTFDYRLHLGVQTTRNAIRILELYDYPPEVIDDAYRTQQHLLNKKS